MTLKQDLKILAGGGAATATSISIMGISMYLATMPPTEAEWTLINYFQLVFGTAGTLLSLVLTLALLGVTGEALEEVEQE